ncbi:PREDICTED: uncharacterized protein LOC105144006 [Acromyrmex echinatior]|uniref:uncharacterized protein LOC105144006 n=1 Tax=Acromyrmex echinatior TaxID=103372 RepID=UPI000580CE59|nr:PREDICTED: uncharacterized protein LOC105144006 [Acromyrmex echinatior]
MRAISLAIPACTVEKRTSLKTATHHMKRRRSNIMEHCEVRLLSRRYNLTTTGYKFLEIRINIGPLSYVAIALGDHRGHELLLSLETWKGLYNSNGIFTRCCTNQLL